MRSAEMITSPVTRMWFNQPSTFHQFHQYHGVDVLATIENENSYRVWFLSGPIISMVVNKNALSHGWSIDRATQSPLDTVGY